MGIDLVSSVDLADVQRSGFFTPRLPKAFLKIYFVDHVIKLAHCDWSELSVIFYSLHLSHRRSDVWPRSGNRLYRLGLGI